MKGLNTQKNVPSLGFLYYFQTTNHHERPIRPAFLAPERLHPGARVMLSRLAPFWGTGPTAGCLGVGEEGAVVEDTRTAEPYRVRKKYSFFFAIYLV